MGITSCETSGGMGSGLFEHLELVAFQVQLVDGVVNIQTILATETGGAVVIVGMLDAIEHALQ